MSENEPFAPDHIKAKEHAAAARERRGPVPLRLSVELPIERQATATNHKGIGFQPEHVEYTAHKGGLVAVTAIKGDPFHCQSFYPDGGDDDLPDWVPTAPAWFDEQVARMRRVAEHDKWMAKRADHKAEQSMGQL